MRLNPENVRLAMLQMQMQVWMITDTWPWRWRIRRFIAPIRRAYCHVRYRILHPFAKYWHNNIRRR